MTLDGFYLYQEENFDAFSKSTIKRISAKIFNEIAAKAERETVLSALSFRDEQKLCTEDTYSLEDDGIQFWVLGTPVIIHDPMLGQALSALPPKRRDVILLFYFADQNEPQIGQALHLSTQAVNYRHGTALERLKELLEAMGYGA